MNQECCDESMKCICSVKGIMEVISKKWTICIVSSLGAREEGYRFNELKDKLDGISSKSLSDRLKELTAHGLVDREVEPTVPPKVTYTLNEEGRKLQEALIPLVHWVGEKEKNQSLEISINS